jgi:hypothetical protein
MLIVVLGGHVTRIREVKDAYKTLIKISKNTISLERPIFRQEDNIKVDLERIGIGMCEADTFR